MNQKRAVTLFEGRKSKGAVVYWMSRDQRVFDNWALLYSQELALKRGSPLCVVFCLAPSFLHASWRQYSFMISGLKEVEKELSGLGIAFILLNGDPQVEVPGFLEENDVGVLVTDFDPLRQKKDWIAAVAGSIDIPFHQVDAHNIVPCMLASSKQEYAARTIRPRIKRALFEFLEDFSQVVKHPIRWPGSLENDWEESERSVIADRGVEMAGWITPGGRAARMALDRFISQRLPKYAMLRNNPVVEGQSGLSPYLHFGHLSAQRVALEVSRATSGNPGMHESKDAFLEELIVRRELSDNFCHYNVDYDRFEGFPPWARATLNAHRGDVREYMYSAQELENAQTHDDLWNASQMEMLKHGKMHGYLRMYWAKKILEWTQSPERALGIAIWLNDRYELDGCDPNGYTGISWSIGGLHDRTWGERPVFGKIRYMSYRGMKSRFDVQAYISKVWSIFS